MFEDFRLRVFVVLAHEKSFTKAASRLRVSQPAVSQHIAELEKAAGVKLFNRLHGEVVLTDSGHIFMKYALSVMSEYSKMDRMFGEYPSSVVMIYASDDVFNFITGHLLADFSTLHPEITFVSGALEGRDKCDIVVSFNTDEKGTITLGYHPSPKFSSTTLWKVLSDALEPAL